MPDPTIFKTIHPWIVESELSMAAVARMAAISVHRMHTSPHTLTAHEVQAIAAALDGLRPLPGDRAAQKGLVDVRQRLATARAVAPHMLERLEAEEAALEARLRPLTEQWAGVGVAAEERASDPRERVCRRCTYRWMARTDRPVKCPRCQARTWGDVEGVATGTQPDPRTRYCARCSYTWNSRKEGDPVKCPRCQSPYWNRADA